MKEIYLDEKQIEEVVIKYLDNHTYNYALMIEKSTTRLIQRNSIKYV